jgi:hypothetical protein
MDAEISATAYCYRPAGLAGENKYEWNRKVVPAPDWSKWKARLLSNVALVVVHTG